MLEPYVLKGTRTVLRRGETSNCFSLFDKFISDSMEMSDEILIEMSYVNISKYRTRVMKSLDGEVLIPSQIARNSGIRTNHISKVLGELKEHELVECINPEVRKGRLYRLTDKGIIIADKLDKL